VISPEIWKFLRVFDVDWAKNSGLWFTKVHFPRTEFEQKIKPKEFEINGQNVFKNNGQNIFENNGQEIFKKNR